MEITTETQRAIIATERSRLPRVLLAEREKEMRDILVPLLFRDGFDCREADDGRPAIDLLASGLRINLVLSCLLMPVVDGYTLLLHVKKHYPQIPFIFVTAINDARIRETVMQGGADDYLTKPFTWEQLLTTIRKVLGRTWEHGNSRR